MKNWKVHLLWAVIAIVLGAVISRVVVSRRETEFRNKERKLEKEIRVLKAWIVRTGGTVEGIGSGGQEDAAGNPSAVAAGESNPTGEEAGNGGRSTSKLKSPKKKKAPKVPPTYDEIVALLNSSKRDDRRDAIKEIDKLKDPRQKAALLREAMKSGDPDLKYRAITLFDEAGKPEGTQLAIDVLQSGESASLRARAARELLQLEDPASISALQNAFLDNDPGLKYWAAKALQGLGWEEPVRQLVAATSMGLTHPDGVMREKTVERLGDLGTSAALTPLGWALDDPNSRVRREAMKSLGNTELAAAIPIIQRGFSDSNRDVREEAIDALYDIGGRQVLQTLQLALSDPDSSVVRRAQRAIERIEKKIAEGTQ